MFEETLEEKMKKTDRQLKQCILELERLDQRYHEQLDQIEELLLEAPMDEEGCEVLQEKMEKWSEELTRALAQIQDPREKKKRFSEKGGVAPHWLFVR